MHFVRAIGQTQRADAGVGFGEAEILAHAGAAMRLDGVVNDLQRHARRRHLDHGDFVLGHFVAGDIHHIRRFETQEPVHLDIDARFGDALFPYRVFGNGLAEGDTRGHPFAHRF